MTANVLLSDLTREEIGRIAPDATVVLPTAAIEQHGPHLPIQTDTLITAAICEQAARLASQQTPVYVAPVIQFGSSHHHFPYPGVVSLTTNTFMQVVRELCESLISSGFHRLAIINGHGRNDPAIRTVAGDISLEHPISIAAASYWTLANPSLAEESARLGLRSVPGHAGAFETALVLALRPELVASKRYPAALHHAPQLFDPATRPNVIRAGQRLGTGPGYTDDPASATAEQGQRLLELISAQVASFLVEFSQI